MVTAVSSVATTQAATPPVQPSDTANSVNTSTSARADAYAQSQAASNARNNQRTYANSNVNAQQELEAFEQILALNAELSALDEIDADSSSSTDTTDDSVLLGADLVNLSPAALNLLNGVNTGIESVPININTAANTNLTPAQQSELATILFNFQNAPLTDQTFTQIENAMVAAGLSPSQLTIDDLLLSFNPSLTLLFAEDTQAQASTSQDSQYRVVEEAA